MTNSTEVFENSTRPMRISLEEDDAAGQVSYFVGNEWPNCFGGRIATSESSPGWLDSAGEEFDMNPTAKPVKKSKKVEAGKKLERKKPLMSVRSLTVNWPT